MQTLFLGKINHALGTLALSIPKGNQGIGYISHLLITLRTSSLAILIPVSRIGLYLETLFLGITLTKGVSSRSMTTDNDNLFTSFILKKFFKKSPFHCRFPTLAIPLALVAVVVVDADEGTGEGEHLAKGGKYAGVDDASGRYAEGDEDEKHAHAHDRKCQEHLGVGLRLSSVSSWESRHFYACFLGNEGE